MSTTFWASNINHPIFKWCSCSPYFCLLGPTHPEMQTLPEVLLSFKFVWKAKSKKKSSQRWVSKYFHKKVHWKRETFVGFFRKSCLKLSGYEIDHESFEKIFLEQLIRGVFVICHLKSYWRLCLLFACVYGMDWKLPNGSTT